jgi:hypothetical protein
MLDEEVFFSPVTTAFSSATWVSSLETRPTSESAMGAS